MINEILYQGEENARTSTELAEMLNIDTRSVRQYVHIERLDGHLICGCNKGYFLPDNDADVKRTISRLFKQGKENINVARVMKNNLALNPIIAKE